MLKKNTQTKYIRTFFFVYSNFAKSETITSIIHRMHSHHIYLLEA